MPWTQGCPSLWDLRVTHPHPRSWAKSHNQESRLTLQNLFTFSGTGPDETLVASDATMAGSQIPSCYDEEWPVGAMPFRNLEMMEGAWSFRWSPPPPPQPPRPRPPARFGQPHTFRLVSSLEVRLWLWLWLWLWFCLRLPFRLWLRFRIHLGFQLWFSPFRGLGFQLWLSFLEGSRLCCLGVLRTPGLVGFWSSGQPGARGP